MRLSALICFISVLFSFSAQALCIKSKRANLRAGPGTHHPITWEVFRYMPLQKIRKKGTWYQVKDFEGDMHWVYQAMLSSQFRCAIIKVNKANLRTGPGTGFPKAADLPVAEKYMSFQLLKVRKGWAQIKDTYNGKYWVFRKLIWVY